MTDTALQAAWQKLTHSGRTNTAPPIDADALAQLASGGGDADSRDGRLAAVGESARNADLLRVLRALEADAAALESDLRTAGQPVPQVARIRPRRHRWVALAASVAVAAMIGVAINAPDRDADAPPLVDTLDSPPAAAADAARGNIMVASFEAGAPDAPTTQRTEIFSGGFDS